MGKPLRQELDEILSQKADADRSDRRTLFQHLDRKKEVVLFGAGNLGRQIATVLHNAGVNIGAFADNQQEIWQTKIEGIPVLPPDKAVSRYGSSAFFLIAMWHPCEKSDVLSATAQLRTLGAKRIAPFSLLLDRFPELLPRLFWSSREELVAHARDIVQTFEQLADETSRGSYLNALRLRLSHDFKAADHVACGKQYFPRDLFRLRNDEVFIDCGAYDGDTMTDFIAECLGKFRKIIAIEADPKNAEKLRRKAVDSGFSHSIETLELVVGSKNGIAKFAAMALQALRSATPVNLKFRVQRLIPLWATRIQR